MNKYLAKIYFEICKERRHKMNGENKKADYKSRLTKEQIFTIPNMLSFLRLALIPLIVFFYHRDNHIAALIVIIISSATDIIDGFIARKFNMITDFGKMIDPVADKLTQLAIIICLVGEFPMMLLPLCIMPIKELVSFILRLRLFEVADAVEGAAWHGKANTVILYLVICLHVLLWDAINPVLSTALIIFSASFMIFSFIMYTVSCVRLIASAKRTDAKGKGELQ